MENNNGYWGDSQNQSQGMNQPNQFQPDPNQQRDQYSNQQYNSQQYNYNQQGAGGQQYNYNQQNTGGQQYNYNQQYGSNQQGAAGPQYNYNQQYPNSQQYNYNQQTAGNQQYNNQYSNNTPPKSGSNDNPGLVMGIIAAICGVFVAPAGIVLGIIGLIKSKNNPKKLAKYLNIAGIVLGVLFLVTIFIYIALFSKMMKSDSGVMYGSTDSEKVVERYFEALEDGDSDQLKKCFVDGANYKLTEDLTKGSYDDYKWDTTGIFINKEDTYTKKELKKEYSKHYGVSIQEAYKYSVICDYTHNTEGEEIPGEGFIYVLVVKSGGRFYMLDVVEVECDDDDTTFAELDTEEDTE